MHDVFSVTKLNIYLHEIGDMRVDCRAINPRKSSERTRLDIFGMLRVTISESQERVMCTFLKKKDNNLKKKGM